GLNDLFDNYLNVRLVAEGAGGCVVGDGLPFLDLDGNKRPRARPVGVRQEAPFQLRQPAAEAHGLSSPVPNAPDVSGPSLTSTLRPAPSSSRTQSDPGHGLVGSDLVELFGAVLY